jgi:hypothetical protein
MIGQINSNRKWLLFWMIFSALAPLCSFIGGYGAIFVLAVLYPLAQTISLVSIHGIKHSWIWMIHTVYWMLVLIYVGQPEHVITAVYLSSLLGQALMRVMFGSFGKFLWLIWNTLGLTILVVAGYVLYNYQITNDFYQLAIVTLSFLISSFLSGLGILTFMTNVK